MYSTPCKDFSAKKEPIQLFYTCTKNIVWYMSFN